MRAHAFARWAASRTRLAVACVRRSSYSYSWSEIADRLGSTRQPAQMRYGDRTDRSVM
jgi:predicted transcriptional regulator